MKPVRETALAECSKGGGGDDQLGGPEDQLDDHLDQPGERLGQPPQHGRLTHLRSSRGDEIENGWKSTVVDRDEVDENEIDWSGVDKNEIASGEVDENEIDWNEVDKYEIDRGEVDENDETCFHLRQTSRALARAEKSQSKGIEVFDTLVGIGCEKHSTWGGSYFPAGWLWIFLHLGK